MAELTSEQARALRSCVRERFRKTLKTSRNLKHKIEGEGGSFDGAPARAKLQLLSECHVALGGWPLATINDAYKREGNGA